MSQTFVEEKLRFEFGDRWVVEKYDGHPDYRSGIQKLRGTKAVDFIGVLDRALYFIEVKDFRGHRIENKERMSNGKLALEVAQKVRDSVAGMVGAFHSSGGSDVWGSFVRAMAKRGTRIQIVLWLEEDRHGSSTTIDKRRRSGASVLQQQLKQNTRWVTTKVAVVNQYAKTSRPPDLRVRNLPGAGQARRRQ